MSLLRPILESTCQLLPEWSPGWLQGPFLCARWVTQHKAGLRGSLCSYPVLQQVPSHLCLRVFMCQDPKRSLIFYYRTIISPLQHQPVNASGYISCGSLSSEGLPAGLRKLEHINENVPKTGMFCLSLDQIPSRSSELIGELTVNATHLSYSLYRVWVSLYGTDKWKWKLLFFLSPPSSTSPPTLFCSILHDKTGCKAKWSSWSSVLVVLVLKDYKCNCTWISFKN